VVPDLEKDVWVMLPALQGGTCLILGDDQELMAEAAKIAKRRLGCSIHKRVPFSRSYPPTFHFPQSKALYGSNARYNVLHIA
jgi:hypothetical protein